MNHIEKFYSDAQRILRHNGDVHEKLPALFCKAAAASDKRTASLAEGIAEYWRSEYAQSAQSPSDAADWFYKMAAFLDGSFDEEMDFPKKDWEELNLLISAESAEMDMELLSALMSVMVSRKKI